MKITMTHKLLVSALVGSGIAYFLNKKTIKKPIAESLNSKSKTNAPKKENLVETTEDKIEYIIDNIGITNQEEMSGFSGGYFYYNPRLGYSLPKGRMPMQHAGDDMDIEGYATEHEHEVYFSAEGSEPALDAVEIISSLSDEDIDLAYIIVKQNKGKQNTDLVPLVKELDLDDESKKIFADKILPRLKDVKALKKNPNWGKSWKNKKDHFKTAKKDKSKKDHPFKKDHPSEMKGDNRSSRGNSPNERGSGNRLK